MSILLALWSFVSQPPVAAALVAGGGWIWSKLRGEKTSSWQDIVSEVGTALATEAIHTWSPGGTFADGMAYVRKYIEDRIWDVLGKRSVPRNAITESIVHYIVESAANAVSSEVAAKLAPLQLPAQLDDLLAKVEAVKTAFVVDPTSKLATVAKELRSMADVTIVSPDAPKDNTP